MQKDLEGAKRDKTVFLRIAKEKNEVGYERKWDTSGRGSSVE